MDINVLIYLVVLFIGTIGFVSSALNRKRKINEEIFIKKAKYRLRLEKKDVLDEEKYKNTYFIMNLGVGLILLILLVFSIIYLGGSIRDITARELDLITILASLVATIFLLRVNVMNYIKENFVTRHNGEKKKHLEISYIMLQIAFLAAFIFGLIKYIIN